MIWLLSCTQNLGSKDTGDPELLGIMITPSNLVLPVGGTEQLSAIGLFEDREQIDLTDSVDWNVEFYAVVEVSDALDSEGQLTALEEGHSRIFAEYEDIRSPYANLTVTEAEIERVSISPSEITLYEGESVLLSAIAHYSDGSSGSITQQARWIIGDGSIAMISEDGYLTGQNPGTTTLTLNYNNDDLMVLPVEVRLYDENGRPDLTITNIEATVEEQVLSIDVQLKNQGNKGAHDFWLDVFLNSDPLINGTGDIFERIEYLAPNSSFMFSTQIPYDLNFGSVSAIVDTNQEQDESHENNNTAQSEITLNEDLRAPDLVVRHFGATLNDQGITYQVEIKNQGETSVEYAFVDLHLNRSHPPALLEDGDYYTIIEALTAGESRTLTFTEPLGCNGCTSWVHVDSYNFVDEVNENNNVKGPLFID
ncbi:MAG: hypothetical protein CMK59_00135 [Proteobacteria bacterium]|nr:hypothetical protein [Pseudomonadota bacterium]